MMLAPRIPLAQVVTAALRRQWPAEPAVLPLRSWPLDMFAAVASVGSRHPFAQLPSSAARCYSGPGYRPSVPSNRIWTFDEVKQQLEAGKQVLKTVGTAGAGAQTPRQVIIVDVREISELQATGKIPGSLNLPLSLITHNADHSHADFARVAGSAQLPHDATLVFYCRAGVRARTAATLAKEAGWKVAEYSGSWLDWERQGGPVEKLDLPAQAESPLKR